MNTCIWEIKGGSAKPNGADLELTTAGAATVDYDADDGEPVADLGDEAYFDLGGDALGVKQGDTTLILTYVFDPLLADRVPSDRQIQRRLEDVAGSALERCEKVAPDYPCGTTDINE